jgi:hypothetical protein
MSDCRRWPVTFRPERGEILYSWLARTAGVYDLFPEELLPEKRRFDAISLLVQEASSDVLKSLATSAGIPIKPLAKLLPVRIPRGHRTGGSLMQGMDRAPTSDLRRHSKSVLDVSLRMSTPRMRCSSCDYVGNAPL